MRHGLVGALLLLSVSVAQAAEPVKIGSLVTGFIETMPVKEGDVVARGDLLFRVDMSAWKARRAELAAQVALRKAQLEDAQRDLAEQQDLYDRTVLASRALQRTQTRVAIAKAQLQAAQAALRAHQAWKRYYEVRAPFKARVKAIQTPAGSTVYRENTPVMLLEPAS